MRSVLSLVTLGVIAAAGAGLTLIGWHVLLPPPGPPVLDCPAEVDLGPQELGSVVVGRFWVGNRGGRELVATSFVTSCSCAGVEVAQNGEAKRVGELRVPPDGRVDLTVRISVGSRPGTVQTILIGFRTSDPVRPEATIQVNIPRVTGRLSAEPTAVVFGDIPIGRPVIKTVRLYANGSTSRQVHAVRSLEPDRFSVRLLPLESAASSSQDDRLVGLVEVTARTDEALKLDGTIEVVLNEEGRASDRIAVLGEVLPAVIARPGAVVLPRSIAGRAEYSAQIALSSRDGVPLELNVDSTPDGLTATVRPDPDNPGQWFLDAAAKPEGRTARTATIRLRANFQQGESSSVEIPVTLFATKS